MTPTEEDSEQTIDTSKIEQGDYTAGGYAPTTADSRYRDNGIVCGWATNTGVNFDRTQIQDLYNFVKSGYTSARTVDARIQSRKGGTDNPRIAWFESYEMGKDNVFVYTPKGVEYNLTKLERYVFQQAGNSIDTYIQCVGELKFREMLKHRDSFLNANQQALINECKQLNAEKLAEYVKKHPILRHC